MKKVLWVVLLIIVVLILIVLVNTIRFTSKQVQVDPIDAININDDSVSQRLAQAIRFKTISDQNEKQSNAEEFLAFHQYLKQAFPKTHSILKKEVVSDYSLLYTWKGRDEELKPVLLMAHMDVVPVETMTEANWEQPPFEGRISDGYVWGRGTMDDKSSVLGILEAVEVLLGQNFQPQRTIYLAFGHDEEVGGQNGAARIASLLNDRRVELEYVLDEGFFIAEGIVPGLTKPVALVGIAEKGFLTLELSVEGEGGHSSVPPNHTTIGILSKAVNRLEEHQMPGHIGGALKQMFEYLGPEMSFDKRMAIANLWLFKPLVERQLSAATSTNATMRTTTAVTIIEGGTKENVLPIRAKAIVNFRLLSGDSIESVIAHAREAINDPLVKITRYGNDANEPSAVSDINAAGFQTLQNTIRQVFPGDLVAPALVVGGTDARHYEALTTNIYRFVPQRYRPDDISRFHGLNERISIANYSQCVKFYYQLIRNSARALV